MMVKNVHDGYPINDGDILLLYTYYIHIISTIYIHL